MNSDDISARLSQIQERIQQARSSPVSAPSITLIAVSKGQPAEAVISLLKGGHRYFGENKVQEAEQKWAALRATYPGTELHLIGSLQRNKVREALTLFDVIQTVDRIALAQTLIKEMALIKESNKISEKGGVVRAKRFFVQVNTGEESQKGGVAPKDLDALLDYCSTNGLPVSGLMCVPPEGKNPAPHFAFLAKLAQDHHIPSLSMGMSGDFEIAVRLGATHVRIGTALFGERKSLRV